MSNIKNLWDRADTVRSGKKLTESQIKSDLLLSDWRDLLFSVLCLQCWKGQRRVRTTSSMQRKARTTSLTSHLLVSMLPETQCLCITTRLQTVQPALKATHGLLVRTASSLNDALLCCDRKWTLTVYDVVFVLEYSILNLKWQH